MLMRLNKYLSHAGIASRRAADKLIEEGKIKVNGKVIKTPGVQVNPNKDQIVYRNKRVHAKPSYAYYALNKPVGYICSSKRTSPTTKLAIDLLAQEPQRLYTIGRLDKASCGLILLTNDGDFAHRVAHPSFDLEKEYLVKVKNEITDKHLKAISAGMRIEGTFVRPVSVHKVRRGTLKITLKEGKKHEVRLLCKKTDLTIKELKRIRIGPLKLGKLPTGSYRTLTSREIQAFSD